MLVFFSLYSIQFIVLVIVLIQLLLPYQTSNVTAVIEVQSASFGLVLHVVLHVQYIFANSFDLSRQPRVTGYNVPFHVHILCIRYGTVLANTAFYVCVYVSFVCRYVAGF